MKISQKLPQFERKESLLLVAGKQELEVYLVSGGIIERLESFELKKPRYSDREAFFIVQGKNVFSRKGSGDLPLKEKIDQDFRYELKETIKRIKRKYAEVFLFAPAHRVNFVKENLPKSITDKISFSFDGDYYGSHPFDLIKKIKKLIEGRRVVPQKEESLKILKKSDQARKIIKRKRGE